MPTSVGTADGSAVTQENFPDFSLEVSSGYATMWNVNAVTPNGTLVFAGSDLGAGGTPFIEFAFADRNVFTASAFNNSYDLIGFFIRASGTPTIALSNPIDPSACGRHEPQHKR